MLPVKHTKKFGPSKLKPTLDNHLMAYVAAASAAGVTTLALAQSAAAKIVYTPANIDVGSSYALDLNHDGIADFTLRTAIFDSGHGQLLSLLFDVPGNAVDNFARPLPIGARIGPGQTFRSSVSSYGGRIWGSISITERSQIRTALG